MDRKCTIYVQDLGGKILVTSQDEGEAIFSPSSSDEAKMHSFLPLISSGTYPIRFYATVKTLELGSLISMEDEGALYEIEIDGYIRSMKISWSS